jgi:heptaprenyl diphosphate synthase
VDKLKLKNLYSDFRPDIELIEKELEKSLESDSPILREASMHLLHAGGKRIRPVFVLLSAKFGNFDLGLVAKAAVALELIHMASLVHDDVIDDSDMRRGIPTVKAQWNNKVAMYTGDFILARSLQYISSIEDEELHQALADTMIEIVKGEIIQIEDQFNLDQGIRDYFRRIKRKTALLIASSCEMGALAAGADQKVVWRLKRFGYFVGMSFQIVDDILDFTATEKELGKPAGSDLTNGNITLPVLYLKDDEIAGPLITKALHGNISDSEMKVLLQYIRSSDALKKAKRISDLYLQKALREVENLPDVPAKNHLKQIALFIGKRKF